MNAGLVAALRHAKLSILGAADDMLSGARVCMLIERDRLLSAVVAAIEGCLTASKFIAGVITTMHSGASM